MNPEIYWEMRKYNSMIAETNQSFLEERMAELEQRGQPKRKVDKDIVSFSFSKVLIG